MTTQKRVLLYGANGFTARLMIDGLKQLPCELILAGRSAAVVQELAHTHGLTHQVFGLDDKSELEKNLRGVDLIINCAGPFVKTAEAITNAALASKTSYFDITGELSVFTSLYEKSAAAKKQGITLIPGMGFDIVPSDCLAVLLAKRVADPQSLALAIVPKNTRVSHGTLKTVVLESKSQRLSRRADGVKSYKGLSAGREVAFNGRSYNCMRAPLGDLLCSNLSTGIVNIDTYIAMPKSVMAMGQLMPLLGSVGRLPIFDKIVAKAIEMMPNGPTKEQQAQGCAYIYGEVLGKNGSTQKAVMRTKEPYAYTADVMIAATKNWLEQKFEPGFLTPSQALGADFAERASPGEVKVEFFL